MSSTSGSGSGGGYTYRGKALGDFLDKRGSSVMGRQRSKSIRRLDRDTLLGLTEGSNKNVATAAGRELDVRREMEVLSQEQLSDPGHPRMKAKTPVTDREVDALRFASSMAQEAQEELNSDKGYKRPNQRTFGSIGMLGVATVDGKMGFGISGSDKDSLNPKDKDYQSKLFKVSHRDEVQKRMLVLQKHYSGSGQTDNWSTQLVAGSAPKIVTDEEGGNVCAASRATAAAMGGSGVENRKDLPVPDSLIEVSSTAVNHRSTHMNDFMALQNTPFNIEKDIPVARRSRSASTGNVMDSCKTCMEERARKMPK